MFGLGLATRIYIAVEAVDMRKGFEGLYGLVRDQLGQDPLSGHLFLFTNRGRSRLKALVWDGSGLTRREFCERHHIAVTTLDHWRRAQSRPARLVKIEVAASEPASGFRLSLANGRRIESQWSFGEAELARLIRVAESA